VVPASGTSLNERVKEKIMRTDIRKTLNKLPLQLMLLTLVAVCLTVYNSPPVDAATAKVFVVNSGDGTVSLVDLDQMKEIKRFQVGNDPYGIAVSADGNTVIVGVEGEEKLKFFDAKDFKLKGELHIGKMFHDHIMLTKDGKHVLVAEYGNDALLAINPETMKEDFRVNGLSGPHVTKYGPTQKRIYVTCKKITGIASVNADDPKDVKFWPLNVNPRSLTFSPDESKLYFGSFWVDGFFQMDTATGKVTKLFVLSPPAENKEPQEVTYHGIESTGQPNVVAAVNEGRSYVDAVDVQTGKLLSRFTDIAKPCCLEQVPSTQNVLVSSTSDAQVKLLQLTADGKFKLLGTVKVGTSPKRVAFTNE
jgi:YVTN family beta-propeller protein